MMFAKLFSSFLLISSPLLVNCDHVPGHLPGNLSPPDADGPNNDPAKPLSQRYNFIPISPDADGVNNGPGKVLPPIHYKPVRTSPNADGLNKLPVKPLSAPNNLVPIPPNADAKKNRPARPPPLNFDLLVSAKVINPMPAPLKPIYRDADGLNKVPAKLRSPPYDLVDVQGPTKIWPPNHYKSVPKSRNANGLNKVPANLRSPPFIPDNRDHTSRDANGLNKVPANLRSPPNHLVPIPPNADGKKNSPARPPPLYFDLPVSAKVINPLPAPLKPVTIYRDADGLNKVPANLRSPPFFPDNRDHTSRDANGLNNGPAKPLSLRWLPPSMSLRYKPVPTSPEADGLNNGPVKPLSRWLPPQMSLRWLPPNY